jgi:large subunit ribosomal protein L29
MKTSELRGMTLDELKGELHDQERGFYNLRFRKSVGEDIHATEFKRIKRDIARIKTLIGEKGRTGAQAPAEGSTTRKQ